MDFGIVKELRGQRIVSIGCGYSHTVAVTEMGKVYSWGSSAFGQLGHGDRLTARLPRAVQALVGHRIGMRRSQLRNPILFCSNTNLFET